MDTEMGGYFSDKWEALAGLPAAIAANPWFFLICFAIGLPLIWLKWKVMGDGFKNVIDGTTHGLRTDGDVRQQRHETGIGTRDVIVMRPPKTPKMIYFSLFFFGGGAVFYLCFYMPSDLSKPSDWWTALGLSGFAIVAMIVIELNQTRIYLDGQTIEKRRVLHRRQTFKLSDIASVMPHAKDFTRGLVIQTHSGEKMRVLAQFSGYRGLMAMLGDKDPKLRLLANLARMQDVKAA